MKNRETNPLIVSIHWGRKKPPSHRCIWPKSDFVKVDTEIRKNKGSFINGVTCNFRKFIWINQTFPNKHFGDFVKIQLFVNSSLICHDFAIKYFIMIQIFYRFIVETFAFYCFIICHLWIITKKEIYLRHLLVGIWVCHLKSVLIVLFNISNLNHIWGT